MNNIYNCNFCDVTVILDKQDLKEKSFICPSCNKLNNIKIDDLKNDPSILVGIRGWLLISYFVLVYTFLVLFNEIDVILITKVFVLSYYYTLILINSILCLYLLFILIFFFFKKKFIPTTIIILFILLLLIRLPIIYYSTVKFNTNPIYDTAQIIISSLIWISYYIKSERVRNTFVN